MKAKFAVAAAGMCLVCSAVPLLAHHSFAAEYDSTKKITITGAVTKVEWMNPHARFYVDVKDESGKVTNWNFELGAIPVLLKQGWRKDSLKVGDQVTVDGSRAKAVAGRVVPAMTAVSPRSATGRKILSAGFPGSPASMAIEPEVRR